MVATLSLCGTLQYVCGCYIEFLWYVEEHMWLLHRVCVVSSSLCVIATLNLCDRLKSMCGCYTEFVWYVEICVWFQH